MTNITSASDLPSGRFSEKAFELSFVAQLTQRIGIKNALWFGLTQQEERRLGFDVAADLPGGLFIFQFKASNVLVPKPKLGIPSPRSRRRFSLPHEQLENLQRLATEFPDSVFYVLPDLGTKQEATDDPDLIARSWFLRVASLPNPFPKREGGIQMHYAFVNPPKRIMASGLVVITALASEMPKIFPVCSKISKAILSPSIAAS